MATAKDIIVKPIKSSIANDFVKANHYSGKVAQNSQLHLGVFLEDRLHGVMQFGPSLDKRKIQGLVSGTLWHEFLELNRMAFDDVLPRNSESRALAIAWCLLRKHAPQVKWVVSFADGTQCGDGTIYWAAGFVLTAIKENNQLIELPMAHELNPAKLIERGCSEKDVKVLRDWLKSLTNEDGRVGQHAHNAKFIPFSGQANVDKPPRPQCHVMSIQGGTRPSSLLQEVKDIMRKVSKGATTSLLFDLMGGVPLAGFQLRYIYFIDPAYRARLTVPELPYSEIEKRGASMYKGQRITRGTGETDNAAETNPQTGGASPTVPLLESLKS